jgi:maltose-binding protein MalE
MKAWHYDTAINRIGSGRLFGLPKDCTTTVMYINADLFERPASIGATFQTSGWTWPQFERR